MDCRARACQIVACELREGQQCLPEAVRESPAIFAEVDERLLSSSSPPILRGTRRAANGFFISDYNSRTDIQSLCELRSDRLSQWLATCTQDMFTSVK